MTEERMDATPMTPSAGPESQELPASLALMGTFMAAQVQLGMGIQEAHEREVSAHNRTRGQLRYTQLDVKRLRDFNLELITKQEQIRAAMRGEEEPTPDGDALAEAREMWAKVSNMERELLEAKKLLESASGQTSRWKRHRAMWQDRVARVLGLPEATEHSAAPDDEPELGQEYDRPDAPPANWEYDAPAEEGNGEPQS